MGMDKNQAIHTLLEGKDPGRGLYSFWTHFPEVDHDPELLAKRSLKLYEDHDLAFIKTMANGLFSVEDYGCVCDFGAIASGGVAKVTKYAIERAEDLERIGLPDPEAGAMGRELRSIRYLSEISGGRVPLAATVFSPLTTLQKMSKIPVPSLIAEAPEAVHSALAKIAKSTGEFAARTIDTGAAGVYFAMQSSTTDSFTEAQYDEFGVPYDVLTLSAIEGRSWFNIAHVHGENIMFDKVADYPVQAFSWHVWETKPTVAEFRTRAPSKTIVGGLQRFHITEGRKDLLAEQIREMFAETGGRRLILAPGCVIRAPFDEDCLEFVRTEIARRATCS
jgi:uroporphyrinogen decarboxylase